MEFIIEEVERKDHPKSSHRHFQRDKKGFLSKIGERLIRRLQIIIERMWHFWCSASPKSEITIITSLFLSVVIVAVALSQWNIIRFQQQNRAIEQEYIVQQSSLQQQLRQFRNREEAANHLLLLSSYDSMIPLRLLFKKMTTDWEGGKFYRLAKNDSERFFTLSGIAQDYESIFKLEKIIQDQFWASDLNIKNHDGALLFNFQLFPPDF